MNGMKISTVECYDENSLSSFKELYYEKGVKATWLIEQEEDLDEEPEDIHEVGTDENKLRKWCLL